MLYWCHCMVVFLTDRFPTSDSLFSRLTYVLSFTRCSSQGSFLGSMFREEDWIHGEGAIGTTALCSSPRVCGGVGVRGTAVVESWATFPPSTAGVIPSASGWLRRAQKGLDSESCCYCFRIAIGQPFPGMLLSCSLSETVVSDALFCCTLPLSNLWLMGFYTW